jgi:hypothetical protein
MTAALNSRIAAAIRSRSATFMRLTAVLPFSPADRERITHGNVELLVGVRPECASTKRTPVRPAVCRRTPGFPSGRTLLATPADIEDPAERTTPLTLGRPGPLSPRSDRALRTIVRLHRSQAVHPMPGGSMHAPLLDVGHLQRGHGAQPGRGADPGDCQDGSCSPSGRQVAYIGRWTGWMMNHPPGRRPGLARVERVVLGPRANSRQEVVR